MSSSPEASQSKVSVFELKVQLILDSCKALESVEETESNAFICAFVRVKPEVTPEIATESIDAVTTLVVSTS